MSMQQTSKGLLRSLRILTNTNNVRSLTTATLLTDASLGPCGAEPYSDTFLRNLQVMNDLVNNLQSDVDHVLQGGGPTSISRHHSRNKMLPRERIKALLDPGSPFLELSQLAGHKLYGMLFLFYFCTLFSPSIEIPYRELYSYYLHYCITKNSIQKIHQSRQGRCPIRRPHHRHRSSQWPPSRHSSQRRHCQRWNLLPYYCQKTPPYARSRGSVSVALCISCRFRRGEFAPSS